ncbi:MAG TPA: HEAT repeat domain-containing protein [Gemmataceae bacterium]|nr:HEAT repeat domain-containing protein [Gemmataceae bacterium]
MNGWYRNAGGILSLLITLVLPAQAVENPAVRQAIEKGVQSLKRNPAPDAGRVGAWALTGLTLLECAVPDTDPVIQNAAVLIRKGSLEQTNTYDLSLALMFLDRLGEPADVELIQSMGVRLLGGQNMAGGWGYICPGNTPEEVHRLTKIIENRTELRSTREPPKPTAVPRKRPVLSKEIEAQLENLEKRGPLEGALEGRDFRMGGLGDNSNTQFAILGIWVARRHGVPVEKALGGVERRFRKTQNGDGGWGYLPDQGSTATMTCAGLLGLALVHGVAHETILRTEPASKETKDPKKTKTKATPGEPSKDPAVRAGLLALSLAIGKPAAKTKSIPPIIPRGFRNHIYYFFWSLERVAVAYDLKTIGNKDWYAWGSEILVASQGNDGTWMGEYGPQIDTCFALLFLQRANLASDLTASLKGKTKDPGEVTLRSGGVGGQALAGKDTNPGFDVLSKSGMGSPAGSSPPPPSKDQSSSNSVNKPENDWIKEAARLSGQLVRAPGNQREKVLEQFTSANGPAYTKALALAIPQLSVDSQPKARDALAQRLMRMSAGTLRDKLKDEDPEIRYAAARACASKEDSQHIPDLIGLLEDRESPVVRAARAGLKHLSGG